MEIFDKPKKLNGTELIQELSDVGIVIDTIFDFADGTIGFITDEKNKAAEIVNKHEGTITPKDLSQKRAVLLEKLGITEDEAKLLLG